MEPRLFGTEKEYTDCVLRLVDASSKFLDDMRAKNIKYLSPTKKGRLDDTVAAVAGAEFKFVKDLEWPVAELDQELNILNKKFQVMRNNYKTDKTLTNFLGDYKKSPEEVYKKLVDFIDASLLQINKVITKYSMIEKQKNPAKQWILTVLSHESTPQATMKARNSNQIMKATEALVQEIRDLCHDAKYELLEIRSIANKYTVKPETSAE